MVFTTNKWILVLVISCVIRTSVATDGCQCTADQGECHLLGERQYACICLDGFAGALCETDLCENGGTETLIAEPCENGGTCMGVGPPDGIECLCPEGFAGDFCDIDNCDCNPCYNGGTCTDFEDPAGFRCDCPSSHEGAQCETDVCEENPCQYGGTCSLDATLESGYSCTCAEGFTGDDCATAICDPECENGGICQHLEEGNKCDCPEEYAGWFCQIDFCDPNPCGYGGTCTPMPQSSIGYECTCPSGDTGAYCEKGRDRRPLGRRSRRGGRSFFPARNFDLTGRRPVAAVAGRGSRGAGRGSRRPGRSNNNRG